MHRRFTTLLDEKTYLYISNTIIDDQFKTNFHSHNNLEILLFTDGVGKLITLNEQYNISTGDLVIINSNAKHCEVSKKLSFYAIGINDLSIFNKEEYGNKIIYLKNTNNYHKVILTLFELIYAELENKTKKSSDIINNAVKLLVNILENKLELVTYKNENKSFENDTISIIKNIIENNYYLDIKLDELAHKLSLSKSKICHEFKMQTNMSIIEYKINLQLQESLNLLKISDMNISQIASLVGFNSTSYFIKVFKNKYGVSPKEYKKALNK